MIAIPNISWIFSLNLKNIPEICAALQCCRGEVAEPGILRRGLFFLKKSPLRINFNLNQHANIHSAGRIVALEVPVLPDPSWPRVSV
jgi:hypothetical protein